MTNTHEQPAPQPGKQVVGDAVLADIRQRMEVGKERYGTYLQTHNGRDALQDAYEEAMDLCMYLKQAIMEKANTVQVDISRLGTLRIAAGELVNDAGFDHERFKSEAINWGDLDCTEAQIVASENGDVFYRVLVEEADPGAHELQKFIAEGLAKAGYGDVEVCMEW